MSSAYVGILANVKSEGLNEHKVTNSKQLYVDNINNCSDLKFNDIVKRKQ